MLLYFFEELFHHGHTFSGMEGVPAPASKRKISVKTIYGDASAVANNTKLWHLKTFKDGEKKKEEENIELHDNRCRKLDY